MTPEEIKEEIKETTAMLKRKKTLLTKYEKERNRLYKDVTTLQKRLKEVDDIITGKAHKYYSEKEYDIPTYPRNRYIHGRRLVATVKYSGLYQEVKSLEEQLGVLKNLKAL
jgi:chromosome segregation ATPase